MDRQRKLCDNWEDRLAQVGLSCVPPTELQKQMATDEVLSSASCHPFCLLCSRLSKAPAMLWHRPAFPKHSSMLQNTLQILAYWHYWHYFVSKAAVTYKSQFLTPQRTWKQWAPILTWQGGGIWEVPPVLVTALYLLQVASHQLTCFILHLFFPE